MKHIYKNHLVLIAIFVAFSLLSSCGGSGSSSGGSSGSTTTPPVNTAPTLASANEDQSGQVGQSFTYDAAQSGSSFNDSDGDTLSYNISLSPDALGLNISNSTIQGTPTADGTIMATITASDGNGGQRSDSFNIVITPADASAKPNIIFIIADDQGKDSSAEYSLTNDVPTTPNLSNIANDGVIFENLWVSPTCSPTRASLISGQYGDHTNVLSPGDDLDASEVILQSYLAQQSATSEYSSAIIGKWHLGGGATGPNDFGLNYFAGIIGGGVNDYYSWSLNENGTRSTSTDYVTTKLTDLAIDWIDGQNNPWFLWLSYNAPHTPFHNPPTNLHTRDLSGTPTQREQYLASIEAMDTEFGRLWDGLSNTERDNTIVIYIGDNGTPVQVALSGIEQNGYKDTLFQGGVNTPMFVSGAGITRNAERETALITHTDFFPTIVELAGGQLSQYQDGKSFVDLLTSSTPYRDHAYTVNADGWAIRNERHKLIQYSDASQDLFDLANDPVEDNDLLDGSTDTSVILTELSDQAALLQGIENITGVKFSNVSTVCSDHVGSYRANATDIDQGTMFTASLEITTDGNECTFNSNSIPNHDFNNGDAGFRNIVGQVSESFTVPLSPILASNTTPLTLDRDNAILLNGVKVDHLAAACFGIGDERTGCLDINQPWRFDPMHGPNGFNVDQNNAHAQPDGAYHYHGPPPISNGDDQTISAMIGFAADGFPIFGPYFDAGDTIRTAVPSYRLISGDRPSGTDNPTGAYDGQYRDDYEFVSGLGDLDACNGMTINGQYGYYVTSGFPYMIGCYSGMPDPSFTK